MQAQFSRPLTPSRHRPVWREKAVSLGRTGVPRHFSDAEHDSFPCAADSVFKRLPAIGDTPTELQKQG